MGYFHQETSRSLSLSKKKGNKALMYGFARNSEENLAHFILVGVCICVLF
jgi:hypothetical protein